MTDGDIVVATIAAASVQDSSGNDNLASVSGDNEITFDTTPPSPPVVHSPTLTSGIEVFANVNINVECENIGDTITVFGSDINPNSAYHVCTSVGPVDIPVTLVSGGAVSLSATTTDPAGNESSATAIEFVAGTAIDNDGDGTSNADESAAPGDDGNGDGIPDYTQGNVASKINPLTGAHSTLESVGSCDFINDFAVVAESSLSIQDDNYDYPVGLKDFELECANSGDSATVTIYYDQVYDTSGWDFRKFDGNGNEYADITDVATFSTTNVNGTDVTTVSYAVNDGGPLDIDGQENGIIKDPAGPAVSTADLSETGDSAATVVAVGIFIALVAVVLSRGKKAQKVEEA
jgi:hypothetical protein